MVSLLRREDVDVERMRIADKVPRCSHGAMRFRASYVRALMPMPAALCAEWSPCRERGARCSRHDAR